MPIASELGDAAHRQRAKFLAQIYREEIMLGITKFELAIVEFGVKSALEYFATPEEHHHLWDDKWVAEVKAKAETGE